MVSTLLIDEARGALDAGCSVVSTANPQLNGTYAIDEDSQGRIVRVIVFTQANGRFPGTPVGGAWIENDINGLPHSFPSTQVYLQWATALGDYAAQLEMIIDEIGSATSLPSQPVTMP